MADVNADPEELQPKKKKLPLLLLLLGAIMAAGAGYYATSSGLILADKASGPVPESLVEPIGDISFVPVDPLIIGIDRNGEQAHLRFRAQLEVPAAHKAEVELVLPRIVDVLNGYLRAVDVQDLENPAALVRLRSQMLRRVAIVVGEERVNDLLVMEFVIN